MPQPGACSQPWTFLRSKPMGTFKTASHFEHGVQCRVLMMRCLSGATSLHVMAWYFKPAVIVTMIFGGTITP